MATIWGMSFSCASHPCGCVPQHVCQGACPSVIAHAPHKNHPQASIHKHLAFHGIVKHLLRGVHPCPLLALLVGWQVTTWSCVYVFVEKGVASHEDLTAVIMLLTLVLLTDVYKKKQHALELLTSC